MTTIDSVSPVLDALITSGKATPDQFSFVGRCVVHQQDAHRNAVLRTDAVDAVFEHPAVVETRDDDIDGGRHRLPRDRRDVLGNQRFSQRAHDALLVVIGHPNVEREDQPVRRKLLTLQECTGSFAAPWLLLVCRLEMRTHDAATRGDCRIEHALHHLTLTGAAWQPDTIALPVAACPRRLVWNAHAGHIRKQGVVALSEPTTLGDHAGEPS
jgi:hypothetical protein